MSTSVTITREDGTEILADAVTNGPTEVNQLTLGESATLSLVSDKDRLIVPEGSTVTVSPGQTRVVGLTRIRTGGELIVDGTLETSQIDNDGTLTNNGTVIVTGGPRSVFDLLSLADNRAGGFTTGETLDSSVTFREFVPDGDSLLVRVAPADGLQAEDMPGIWGLVEDVTDARRPALNLNQIELSVRVVAQLQEYDAHTDVRDALEV